MDEPRQFTDRDFEPAALDALDGTTHVFLTGRAGTGKSTLINHWIRTRGRGGRTLTCAPTGIAALNAGGVTIHQLIHAGPDITPERAAAEGRRHAGDPLYRILDTLVIDEVSMLRADLADSLDRFLKGARRSRQPFGGIRLIMVGDLAQLPPIVTKEDGKRFDGGEWDGPWFFQSHAVQTILDDNRLQGVELTRAHRQTDRAFLDALDDMRDGHPAPGTLAMLNRLFRFSCVTGVGRACKRRCRDRNAGRMFFPIEAILEIRIKGGDMLVVIIVFLVICSALMFYLWWICRKDGLALNAVAGIKTMQTMASEETWLYIHRKYCAVFCVDGVIVAVMCVALAVYALATGDVNGGQGNLWWIALLVGCVALLATLIPVGIVADRDAARYNKEHGHAPLR